MVPSCTALEYWHIPKGSWLTLLGVRSMAHPFSVTYDTTCWEEPFHGASCSVGQCLLCLCRLRVRLSIGVRRSINAEIAIRMLGNGSVQNRSALYMLKRSSIMIHDYA
jgi:hypothetical protein